jgi:hypothetical protein
MRFVSRLVAAWIAMLSLPAAAQEPPDRAGRLAFAEGSVSVYMDPDIGWEPAYVNTPITSENSVWTDMNSRAELRVSGISLRLDETTQLDVSQLLDDGMDATLVRGALSVHVRHLFGTIAINTPQARYVLLGPGRYRIDTDPERGDSRLTVFDGRAAMEGASGRVPVPAGRSIVAWGNDRPAYALEAAFTTDFDRWAMTRDNSWVERESTRYVSSYMTGYEDLDPHGQWVSEPDYGPIWIPTRVATDWVPYRYGHWAWVRPWGWTWIDDQPWGYAPFHYGRWVYVRGRWCWYPGHRVDRPVWAPALVAWVGGSNWSVSVRSAPAPVVGWYPLSPFERYQPWYHANTRYVNNVNVNVTITNRDRAGRYAERQREITRTQAATVVQRETLVARRPVQQAIVHVAPDVVRRQPVAQQPTSLLPSRNDFVRAHRETRTASATTPAPAAVANPAERSSPVKPGAPAAAPVMQPPTPRPSFAREPRAPAPQAAPANATPPPAAPVARVAPPGQQRVQENQNPRDAREANTQPAQPVNPAAREAPRQPAPQNPAGRVLVPPSAPPATNPLARGQPDRSREAQQQLQQEQQSAQQQQRQRAQEQAAREQQQRAQQQQQRAQEQAAREQQQRAQQEQQRAQQQLQLQQQQLQQQHQQQQQQQLRAQQEQQQRQRAQQEQQRAQQPKPNQAGDRSKEKADKEEKDKNDRR